MCIRDRRNKREEDIRRGRTWAGSEKVNCEVSSFHPLVRELETTPLSVAVYLQKPDGSVYFFNPADNSSFVPDVIFLRSYQRYVL